MRLIAFVTDSGSITRILAYLGEPTKAPYIAPAGRGPPWEEDFDTREGGTFALSERATSESQGQGVALLGAPRTLAGQSRDGCFTPLPEYEFDQRLSG
ncbi:MAG: hypothetical protein ACREWE_08305 [Gammaproteobacteria bacterium]